MKPVFNEREFDDQTLQCTHCQWQGKGSDAVIIDLYGITDYQEVHCPSCDAFLGNLKKSDSSGGETAGPISFQTG
jgi:hypothetical protein